MVQINIAHRQIKVIEQNNVQAYQDNLQKKVAAKNTITTAARVEISKAAKNKYQLEFKEADPNKGLGAKFRNFYESNDLDEAIEKIELERTEKQQLFNRLNQPFSEGTLQHTIQTALEGKLKNVSLYANELADAIRGTATHSEKTVEKRAIYRETALAHAKYIAATYFDNEKEAEDFLNEIKKYAENDILREKGYTVLDGSNLEPFKSYSSPMAKNGEISFHGLIKHYMEPVEYERFINGEWTPEESSKFLLEKINNGVKYQEEKIEADKQNEQAVTVQLNEIQALMEELTWENGSIIKSIDGFEQYNTFFDEAIAWNEKMFNLLL